MQHLTCVKDAQGLMCTIDESQERDHEVAKKAGTAKTLKASTVAAVPQLISSTQLGFISNVLLGFLYFVLPVGLGLGIFLHDKYYAYRSNLVKEQIDLLERLWKQSPQNPQH